MVDEARGCPGAVWETAPPAEFGLNPERLARARQLLEAETGAFRLIVVRHGRIAAEANRGVAPEAALPIHSAVKSVHATMLGIAVAEGRLPSAEVPLAEVFPEALDVPEGRGPKPGRHIRPKDRAITLRQLACNVSGYMKPDERPGEVFHYQTYGMNVLAHAIGRAYGLYDPAEPEASRYHELVGARLRDPIGAGWTHGLGNFALPPEARTAVFGYAESIAATARDLARLGLLWCRHGRWGGSQLVPRAWIEEATATSRELLAHAPVDQHRYGLGFWTNDQGRLFPSLPRDAFAAWGSDRKASAEIVFMVPSRDLVIVLAPAPWTDLDDPRSEAVLGAVVASVT